MVLCTASQDYYSISVLIAICAMASRFFPTLSIYSLALPNQSFPIGSIRYPSLPNPRLCHDLEDPLSALLRIPSLIPGHIRHLLQNHGDRTGCVGLRRSDILAGIAGEEVGAKHAGLDEEKTDVEGGELGGEGLRKCCEREL
jgi:hypothetical protein